MGHDRSGFARFPGLRWRHPRWVEQRRIQGGILIVIREGRLAWHEAVGWNDRERGVPLQKDDILLMRSMTKPLRGPSRGPTRSTT